MKITINKEFFCWQLALGWTGLEQAVGVVVLVVVMVMVVVVVLDSV